ncbi:MAG: hypothetical protein ACUX7D_03390 [Candidatus Methanodesulfokora washburnensis]
MDYCTWIPFYVFSKNNILRMRGAPLPLKAIYEDSNPLLSEMERVVNVNYPTTVS